jgi:hypothetical protein
VGSVLASLEPTPKTLRAACRKVSGRYLDGCLRGAGLIA